MTPERIAEIEARHNSRTALPWNEWQDREECTQRDVRVEAQARDKDIAALLEDNKRMRAALVDIAAVGDNLANERLKHTGSYGGFDEPGSVELARAALSQDAQT